MSQQPSRRDFWHTHYQRCRERGMTLKAYAGQEGLTLSVFYRWSRRFRKERETPAAGFSRVQVIPGSSARYRLHLPNGRVLEWEGEVDSDYLGRLARALA